MTSLTRLDDKCYIYSTKECLTHKLTSDRRLLTPSVFVKRRLLDRKSWEILKSELKLEDIFDSLTINYVITSLFNNNNNNTYLYIVNMEIIHI